MMDRGYYNRFNRGDTAIRLLPSYAQIQQARKAPPKIHLTSAYHSTCSHPIKATEATQQISLRPATEEPRKPRTAPCPRCASYAATKSNTPA